MTAFLIVLLFAAVAAAVYQFSEARRWRDTANEARSAHEQQRAALEQARRDVIAKEAESIKNREVAEVQLKLLTQTQQQLEERFRLLAADALQTNSQMFLDRSREQIQRFVEPVSQSLQRFEEQVRAVELARTGAYEGLTAQMQVLTQLQERVRESADQLKTALRSPIQRGRWGEIQLRRVVELAGMLEYCDFAEQQTLFGDTNQRPDLIVRMPNQCEVVVDAKVSLEAYLRAIETQDEVERRKLFAEHAKQVKTHVKALSEKSYWERLACSPEFVVAFLPLESLFSAALEHEPGLLDFGISQRVVIATPTTLITLLLTVAQGWRQRALAENIDQIRQAGQELYKRLLKAHEHFTRLGDAIERTVNVYNETVGSLEKNVLPSARRFRELHPATIDQLDEIEPLAEPRRIDDSKWVVNG